VVTLLNVLVELLSPQVECFQSAKLCQICYFVPQSFKKFYLFHVSGAQTGIAILIAAITDYYKPGGIKQHK
jgi:hypothetical protein